MGAGAFTLFCFAMPAAAQDGPKPIRALLVIGGCCHDYKKQKDILVKGLGERLNIEVTVSYDPDTSTKHLNPVYEKADWAKGYDVIIHDECSADVNDAKVVDRILQPHRDGVPAVLLHCAMHCYRVPNSKAWFEFTGLTTRSHGPQQPIDITYADSKHPINKNLSGWKTINEELYKEDNLWKTATPLAKGKQGKSDYVCVWTNAYSKNTRVFATTLGHNNETVADPRYLDLIANGLLWSTGHLNENGEAAPGYAKKK
ncbi:MAG: ThuA domain-containing protein [Gemmataceae bacterium]